MSFLPGVDNGETYIFTIDILSDLALTMPESPYQNLRTRPPQCVLVSHRRGQSTVNTTLQIEKKYRQNNGGYQ